MNYVQLLFLFIFVIQVVTSKDTGYCSEKITLNPSTVILSHVILRHGERYVLQNYPKDPEPENENDFGKLTYNGKKQVYDTGVWIREHYKLLLNDGYSEKTVLIKSSAVTHDRTEISAKYFAAGAFLKNKKNQTFDLKVIDNMGPIKIQVIPNADDNIIGFRKKCPRFKQLQNQLRTSEKYLSMVANYTETMMKVTELSGFKVEKSVDATNLNDILTTKKIIGRKVENWATPFLNDLNRLAMMNFKTYSGTTAISRARGFLLREIVENFYQKTHNKEFYKLIVYSGHDYTILDLLNALGLYTFDFLPPFGSSVLFELHEIKGKYYVQILYRFSADKEPLVVCKCLLDDFKKNNLDIIPTGDFDVECAEQPKK